MSIFNELGELAKDFNRGYNIGDAAMKVKGIALGGTALGTEAVANDMTSELASDIASEATAEVASEMASEVATEEGANILIEVLSFFFE